VVQWDCDHCKLPGCQFASFRKVSHSYPGTPTGSRKPIAIPAPAPWSGLPLAVADASCAPFAALPGALKAFMGYLGALALLAGAHTLATISPGPNFLFVSSTAMQLSRRAGIAAGLGVAVATITWSALTLGGLGLIISRSPEIYDALRLLGAVYLIWLGGKMTWKAGGPVRSHAMTTKGGWTAAHKAWLVTMTNPKSMAYYGSVFAVLLPSHAPVWVYAAAVSITSLISSIWYCGVAWLLSGEAPRRAFLKARTAMERVIGLFLVGLGIRMLTSR
jgi:threonine efflux protein